MIKKGRKKKLTKWSKFKRWKKLFNNSTTTTDYLIFTRKLNEIFIMSIVMFNHSFLLILCNFHFEHIANIIKTFNFFLLLFFIIYFLVFFLFDFNFSLNLYMNLQKLWKNTKKLMFKEEKRTRKDKRSTRLECQFIWWIVEVFSWKKKFYKGAFTSHTQVNTWFKWEKFSLEKKFFIWLWRWWWCIDWTLFEFCWTFNESFFEWCQTLFI